MHLTICLPVTLRIFFFFCVCTLPASSQWFKAVSALYCFKVRFQSANKTVVRSSDVEEEKCSGNISLSMCCAARSTTPKADKTLILTSALMLGVG